MRIAFDMDGVLKYISLSQLAICDVIKDKGPFVVHRKQQGYPLLNPMLLALPQDELFVISNCRDQESIDRKKRWLNHFYGNRIRLIPITVSVDKWGKEYVDPTARAKLNKCYEYDIDAYFDDDPALIRKMREYHQEDINKSGAMQVGTIIKFFKYGPFIEEIY